ncbi:hypothetical protein RF11_01361 [Thelohanellus kitauei]|uniref:Uncharacterized protein n=1 Tax=Thelohanellus kitauei TaxID=669202 RepID=A0A0C2NCW7_THEKT|nr:hypothetical protein RF11_01361 [Thelohanellus kitauei]
MHQQIDTCLTGKKKPRAKEKFEMLDEAQTAAFVKIVMCVENKKTQRKLFYINGASGSGKNISLPYLIVILSRKTKNSIAIRYKRNRSYYHKKRTNHSQLI